MLIKKQTYYVSDQLTAKTPTLHGFSRRSAGDMRRKEIHSAFLTTLGISGSLYMVRQVHGNRIVEPIPGESKQSEADGILLLSSSDNRDTAIGILVADCVPIILADTDGVCIAAVHAGWKGTLLGIVSRAVSRMKDAGAKPEHIIAGIGPRIGPCCYNVPEDRAQIIRGEFGEDPRFCYSMNTSWYVDIGYLNMMQLEKSGVSRDRIDAAPMCTSCQVSELYSYRKDSKDSFGEQAGIIAFRSRV